MITAKDFFQLLHVFIRTGIISWYFPKECSVNLSNISPLYLLTFDGVFLTQAVLLMLTGGCGLAKQVLLL